MSTYKIRTPGNYPKENIQDCMIFIFYVIASSAHTNSYINFHFHELKMTYTIIKKFMHMNVLEFCF